MKKKTDYKIPQEEPIGFGCRHDVKAITESSVERALLAAQTIRNCAPRIGACFLALAP